MSQSFKQSGLDVISGADGSFRAKVLRAVTAAISPVYSTVMRARNLAYDRGLFKSHPLGRPTISVGNITTGGTGKTPVVQWLAGTLRSQGKSPAILLRGYGSNRASNPSGGSDEARMLDVALNPKSDIKIPVQANPSRMAGAAAVLSQFPQTDLFILDDGFQHRRARRDFNLVLLNAIEPFGFGRVLPRGLLREPLCGLDRAEAFLITRCSLADPMKLAELDQYLASQHPGVHIYHADHVISGLWSSITHTVTPIGSIAGHRIFLTAGIGDPGALEAEIKSIGCTVVGTKWFDDHHDYNSEDWIALLSAAAAAGAERLVTTEKDWVKIQKHVEPNVAGPEVCVTRLEIRFRQSDAADLLKQIDRKLSGLTNEV